MSAVGGLRRRAAPGIRRASAGTTRGELRSVRLDVRAQPVLRGVGDVVPERLGEELVRRGEVLFAMAEQHAGAVVEGGACGGGGDRRLPEPGLARDEEHLTAVAAADALRRVGHDLLLGRRSRSHPRTGRTASRSGSGTRARGRRPALGSGDDRLSVAGSHTTRKVSTGPGRPFSSSAPTGSNVWLPRLPTRDRTSALDEDRARLGGGLEAGSLDHRECRGSRAPRSARRRRSRRSAARAARAPGRARLRRSVACCTATAALSASVAASKTAIRPSPVDFTTRPCGRATAAAERLVEPHREPVGGVVTERGALLRGRDEVADEDGGGREATVARQPSSFTRSLWQQRRGRVLRSSSVTPASVVDVGLQAGAARSASTPRVARSIVLLQLDQVVAETEERVRTTLIDREIREVAHEARCGRRSG